MLNWTVPVKFILPRRKDILQLIESTASTFGNKMDTNYGSGSALSASMLKCYLPEGKTSVNDYVIPAAVGQTKAACEAAGSSCIWSYKEDKSPATDDHKCVRIRTHAMAAYTANNIPAPYKAFYQWVSHYGVEYLRTTTPTTSAPLMRSVGWQVR